MSNNKTIFNNSPVSKSPFNSRIVLSRESLSPNPIINEFIPSNNPVQNMAADYTVPFELKNRIFVRFDYGTHNFDTTGWNSNTNEFIATFQGNRISSPHGNPNTSTTRAYAWEFNPINPNVSSPWHNVIYESVIEAYKWGARSLHFWFPFGGSAMSFALTTEIWKRTFNSTTDPKTCPARWKGFFQAIKALVEGNLRPEGKDPIDEPCNVAIYSSSNRAYNFYIQKSDALWESLGTTVEERDRKYYEYLDGFISDLLSMKGQTPNSGKIYFLMDTAAYSPTPTNIQLFRNKPTFKSDALELSDWYMFNKLVNNGIACFVESRPVKTVTDGTTGVIYTNDFAYKPSVSSYYWWLFSNPTRNTCCNYATAEDVKTAFTFMDANFPLVDTFFDPFRPKISSTLNGRTRTLSYTDTNPPGGANYNTPHQCVWSFYILSDNYRYFYNKQTNTNTFKGVKLDTDCFVDIEAVKYLAYYTMQTYDGQHDPLLTYWRVRGVSATYRPRLNVSTWNSIPNIANYGSSSDGLWSDQGANYWDTNVRSNSFDDLMTFVDTFSRNYAPVSDDWSGTVYGSDPVAIGTIHYV